MLKCQKKRLEAQFPLLRTLWAARAIYERHKRNVFNMLHKHSTPPNASIIILNQAYVRYTMQLKEAEEKIPEKILKKYTKMLDKTFSI